MMVIVEAPTASAEAMWELPETPSPSQGNNQCFRVYGLG